MYDDVLLHSVDVRFDNWVGSNLNVTAAVKQSAARVAASPLR